MTLLSLLGPIAFAAQDEQEQAPLPKMSETYAPAKPGVDVVDLLFNFYGQSDHGGNPNQKEAVSIFQPMALVSKSLSKEWTLSMTLQSDLFLKGSSGSGASGTTAGTAGGPAGGGEEDGEGGGESGFFGSGKIQYGGSLALTHLWSPTTSIGAGVSFSEEAEYRSLGGHLRWSHDTADRNDTFSAHLSAYFDSLNLVFFDGTHGGSDHRTTINPGISWTHVLGERTLSVMSYDLTLQDGFLGTPSQSVLVGGVQDRELLPSSRTRHAFHGRLRHLLLDHLAIEPGASYYFDTWGARAYSLQMTVLWEPIPDALIVRPMVRFHNQSAVDYFLPYDSTVMPALRTQDSDLGRFTVRTAGARVSLLKSFLLGQELDLEGSYSRRSDGLSWVTVSIGITWK
jgi:hypothetical protein